MTVRSNDRSGRRFASVTDVRHEVFRIYHAVRLGRMDSLDGVRRVKILETGAQMMMQTEAELKAAELAGKIEQVRQELASRGLSLPMLIDMTPDKVIN